MQTHAWKVVKNCIDMQTHSDIDLYKGGPLQSFTQRPKWHSRCGQATSLPTKTAGSLSASPKTCSWLVPLWTSYFLGSSKTDERSIADQNPYGSNDFFVVLGRSLCRLGASESFGSTISTFCVWSWPRIKYSMPRKVCKGILSMFCWSWMIINLINVFLSVTSTFSYSAFSRASSSVFASSKSITQFWVLLSFDPLLSVRIRYCDNESYVYSFWAASMSRCLLGSFSSRCWFSTDKYRWTMFRQWEMNEWMRTNVLYLWVASYNWAPNGSVTWGYSNFSFSHRVRVEALLDFVTANFAVLSGKDGSFGPGEVKFWRWKYGGSS